MKTTEKNPQVTTFIETQGVFGRSSKSLVHWFPAATLVAWSY